MTAIAKSPCPVASDETRSRRRGLWRAEGGGMMIEFAFVAPFVILLLVATTEVAVTLFVGATLEGAAEGAARQIRTGQVQESDDPVVAFQTKFCEAVLNLIDCNEVMFDVRGFSDFGSADMALEFDEDGQLVGAQFSPGDSGEITVVRVVYRWRYLTALVSDVLSPDGSGTALLMATMAFQNEPYELGG
jgi:Flp pilus assembly protein TadG